MSRYSLTAEQRTLVSLLLILLSNKVIQQTHRPTAVSGLGGVHSLSLSVGGYLQGDVCHQAALGGAALKPSDTLAAKKGSRGEV